jgi:hypothetical protein
MRLITTVRHTYDGRTYDVGDTYEVADAVVADTIIGNGMAREATAGVGVAPDPTPGPPGPAPSPSPSPPPPPLPAPPVHHAPKKHKP